VKAVADRFGRWGTVGQPQVAWGDWPPFVAYTAQVNAFLPPALTLGLSARATLAKSILGTSLLLALGMKLAAWDTDLLTLLFALVMTISFGLKAPLDYSVWALLLGQARGYTWSLDAWWANQHSQRPYSIFERQLATSLCFCKIAIEISFPTSYHV
jgi:hypothetical protein